MWFTDVLYVYMKYGVMLVTLSLYMNIEGNIMTNYIPLIVKDMLCYFRKYFVGKGSCQRVWGVGW